MANLDETFRQYVQEETADKFLGGDSNGITILGGEADAVVVDANESAVGDADPVGISAEVVENLLWATERSFAVNDPIDAVELVFQRYLSRKLCPGGRRRPEIVVVWPLSQNVELGA